MQRLFPLLFALIVSLLAGCNPASQKPEEALGVDAWLPLKVGEVELVAQVVLTDGEQRKGLMYRDSLRKDGGMLFPYNSPRPLSFWMANTRIPLDIGFFDSKGLLLEVHRMVPFDTSATQSKARDLQFALEMNTGWFRENGLYPGQKLDLELVAEALRKRGADPQLFGLSQKRSPR